MPLYALTLVTLHGPVVGVPGMTECSYPFPTVAAAVRFARAHGCPSRPAVVQGVGTFTEQPDPVQSTWARSTTRHGYVRNV